MPSGIRFIRGMLNAYSIGNSDGDTPNLQRMWLASRSCAAPTGRHCRCRCCRLAARSWLRPPTADCARRERSLRSVLVRSRGDYGMVTPTDASAPDTARVFRTARIARWEVAARNRLRSRSGFAVPRRAPTAVGGRSQARRRAAVDDHWAGLPGDAVPALAGRGRLERGTRCARSVHGGGKAGGAIPRGEFAPSDPSCADNPRRIGRNASVGDAPPLLAAHASTARV